MSSTEQPGCCPDGVSRRGFLRGAGLTAAAVAAAGSMPLLSSRAAYAADPSYSGPILLVLSLRGGFDGLSAIAPVGDADYVRARPTLAVPAARAIATGNRIFGLHPALAPLHPLWTAGKMTAVHAVGTPDGSRSHFKATEELERAAPGTSLRSGWLDRVLGLHGSNTLFQAVKLGSARPSGLLAGGHPSFAARDLGDVQLASFDWVGARMTTALRSMHTGSGTPTEQGALAGIDALNTVAGVRAGASGPQNGASYPANSPLASALEDAATVVRAGLGLRALSIDVGDWDLHSGLGAGGNGPMATKLTDLANSLAAFATDLGAAFSRVTVVTISEFGRRVAENGSGGTDHGHGNAVMLLGGGLVGNTVHGRWPGLAAANLDHGDLAGTTDYRNVLAEFLVRRLGMTTSALGGVFPGLTYSPVGAFV